MTKISYRYNFNFLSIVLIFGSYLLLLNFSWHWNFLFPEIQSYDQTKLRRSQQLKKNNFFSSGTNVRKYFIKLHQFSRSQKPWEPAARFIFVSRILLAGRELGFGLRRIFCFYRLQTHFDELKLSLNKRKKKIIQFSLLRTTNVHSVNKNDSY
jgi:hypothetical protein